VSQKIILKIKNQTLYYKYKMDELEFLYGVKFNQYEIKPIDPYAYLMGISRNLDDTKKIGVAVNEMYEDKIEFDKYVNKKYLKVQQTEGQNVGGAHINKKKYKYPTKFKF
jgi:hypothetical protein